MLKSHHWIGDKKINQLVRQLEQSKTADLWRIMTWLGIRHVGKKISQELVKAWSAHHQWAISSHTVCELLADKLILESIYGIWAAVIESCIDFAHTNLKIIKDLEYYGVQFIIPTQSQWSLSWVRFCITWTLEISRNQLSQQLIKLWWEFCENLNKNVNVLIVWQDAWSKIQKAQKRWITILEWIEATESYFGIDIPR